MATIVRSSTANHKRPVNLDVAKAFAKDDGTSADGKFYIRFDMADERYPKTIYWEYDAEADRDSAYGTLETNNTTDTI